MSGNLPRLGVTAYSMTPVFHGLQYTFEEIVTRIGARGLGPGLEVVGFQSIPNFPVVSPDFVKAFKGLLDQTGLEPSCLATNADLGLRSDRLLNDDEMVEYMSDQLEAAVELGFPCVRLQKPVSPAVVERLLPTAEKADIKMGFEIHSPDTVDTDWVLALRETYARLDSPLLGFIPDWGSSTRGPAPGLWDSYRQRGASEAVIEGVKEAWAKAKLATAPRTRGG